MPKLILYLYSLTSSFLKPALLKVVDLNFLQGCNECRSKYSYKY